jgi:hypothetical protein
MIEPTSNILMMQWLSQFESNRKGTFKPGMPLWALKVSDKELHELCSMFKQLFAGKDPQIILNRYSCTGGIGKFDALFTLFLATWIQRNFEGGKARWAVVLNSISIKHSSRLNSSIYDSVCQGLKYWGISLHKTSNANQYFATLYCQGGFPRIGLVGLSHGPVPSYLDKVIDSYSQFHHTTKLNEIAERAIDDLPETLKQSAFATLASELISCLLSLRDRYDLYSESDPVLALDLKNPAWRDELPFLLCDEEAYELMRRLLHRAASIIHREQNPVRISRFIEPSINSWQLVAETYINQTIHPEDLNRVLDCKHLPNYFDLYTQTETGERSRSASFNLKGFENKRWQVVTNQTRFFNSDAAAIINYELWSDGNQLGKNTYYRGEELNVDLPWSFSVNGEKYRYIGQGNIATEHESVLVVFGGEINPENSLSKVEKIASIDALNKSIYKVTGCSYVTIGLGKLKITTGSQEAKEFRCWLEGDRCTEAISSKYTYRGIPTVYMREGLGEIHIVPAVELYWQLINSKEYTRVDNLNISSGMGTLIWQIEDEIKWQSKLTLLPEGANFNLIDYGSGELELKAEAFANKDLGIIEPQQHWLRGVYEYDDLFIAEIQLPAKMSEVINPVMGWDNSLSNKVVFEVETNQTGICLLTPEGRSYNNIRNTLTLDDLYSHKLKIQLPKEQSNYWVSISAVLKDKGKEILAHATDRVELEGASSVISSGVLAKLAQLLFSQSDSLYDYVQFKFYGKEILSSKISKVERFKHTAKNVILNDQQYLKICKSRTHKDRDAIKLFAAPIWNLDRLHIELNRIDNSSNDVLFALPDTNEFGPWFVYSSLENKIQPRVVIIKDDTTDVVYECIAQEEITLATAIKELKFDSELHDFDFSTMDFILNKISKDLENKDWDTLQSYVVALDYAEPSTFHIFRRLLHVPELLITLLLKQTEQRSFENIWLLSSQMPFEWLSIPFSFWKVAINHIAQQELIKAESLRSVFSSEQFQQVKKGLLLSKFESLINKGAYFQTIVETSLFELYGDKPVWLSSDIYGEDNSQLSDFHHLKKDLFKRHEGKLLRSIQNKTNDLALKSLLENKYSRSFLPIELRGFVQHYSVDPHTVSNRAIAIDLPIKLAMNNRVIFEDFELLDNEQRLINFALNRLQQFDREWLQQSMACALKAASIYQLVTLEV